MSGLEADMQLLRMLPVLQTVVLPYRQAHHKDSENTVA